MTLVHICFTVNPLLFLGHRRINSLVVLHPLSECVFHHLYVAGILLVGTLAEETDIDEEGDEHQHREHGHCPHQDVLPHLFALKVFQLVLELPVLPCGIQYVKIHVAVVVRLAFQSETAVHHTQVFAYLGNPVPCTRYVAGFHPPHLGGHRVGSGRERHEELHIGAIEALVLDVHKLQCLGGCIQCHFRHILMDVVIGNREVSHSPAVYRTIAAEILQRTLCHAQRKVGHRVLVGTLT